MLPSSVARTDSTVIFIGHFNSLSVLQVGLMVFWNSSCTKYDQGYSRDNKGPRATSLTWETVPINKLIFEKLCHNIDYEGIKRVKKKLFCIWELNFLSVISWIHFTQGSLVPSLVEWAQWFLRERFCLYFCYFLIRMWPFIFKKLKFPSLKDNVCQVELKLAPCFWKKGIVNLITALSLVMLFNLPLKKSLAFIWTNFF